MNFEIFLCASGNEFAVFSATINGKSTGVVVIDCAANCFTLYNKNGEITCCHPFPYHTTNIAMKKEYILKTLNNPS